MELFRMIYLLTLVTILGVCASDSQPSGKSGMSYRNQQEEQMGLEEIGDDDEFHVDMQHGTISEKVHTPSPPYSDLSSSSVATTVEENINSKNNVTNKDITRIHNPLFPVTNSSYIAYGILFLALVVFALGLVGNLAVMCIVWQNYFMRSAWNYILASVAFWDFLVLCFCLPVVVFNELTHKRLLGDFSCRVVPYIEVGLS